MCAHSSSGKEITNRIELELYPAIDACFIKVNQYIRHKAICNGATNLFDLFYSLKTEFESLKNYDTRLVFPSVLKLFNSKENPTENPKVNIGELQMLTQKKEHAIMLLVGEIESEAELLQLDCTHPISPLVKIFKTDFFTDKKEWNDMLTGWTTGCACFSAGSNAFKNNQNG